MHKNSLKSILFSSLLTLGFLGTGFVGEVYAVKRSNTMDDVPTKRQQAQKIELSFEKIINELPLTKESKQTLLANKDKISHILFQKNTAGTKSILSTLTGIYIKEKESTNFFQKLKINKNNIKFKISRDGSALICYLLPKSIMELYNRMKKTLSKDVYNSAETTKEFVDFLAKNLIHESYRGYPEYKNTFVINNTQNNEKLNLVIQRVDSMYLELQKK